MVKLVGMFYLHTSVHLQIGIKALQIKRWGLKSKCQLFLYDQCRLQGGKLAAQYDVGSKDQRSLEFKEEWEKAIENK